MSKEEFPQGQEKSKEEKKHHAWIEFGGGGHSGEYLVHLKGYNIDNYIPEHLSTALKEELGEEWEVSNRGTRIEITNRKDWGRRDDAKIVAALKKVLGDNYKLDEYLE